MRKWCLAVVLAAGWLTATTAADAQTGPAPVLPPALPPPPGAAPAAPGVSLPPPQGNFSLHSPFPSAPNGVAAIPPPASGAPAEALTVIDPDPPAFTGASDAGPPNAFNEEHKCPCGPPFHVDLEYLAWWTNRESLPALVTSGSLNDPVPGALGQPNTQTLISGETGHSFHNGARVSLSWEIGDERTCIADVGGFYLGSNDSTTSVSSDGGPNTLVIARPFFNGNTNAEDADPVAVPNVMSGTIAVKQQETFYGADATLHWNYWSLDNKATAGYVLVGCQFLTLNEKLLIGESLQDIPGLGAPGNSYLLNENFSTVNRFYGATLGLEYLYSLGCVTLKAQGKVGFGYNRETSNIGGFTQITDSSGNVTTGANRALLVQPSNAGTLHVNRFAVAPELNLSAAYDFNEYVRVGVAYDFLGLSSALRPADQIDRTVTIQALQPFDQVGPARPAPQTNQSFFWAQGVNFTVEFSF